MSCKSSAVADCPLIQLCVSVSLSKATFKPFSSCFTAAAPSGADCATKLKTLRKDRWCFFRGPTPSGSSQTSGFPVERGVLGCGPSSTTSFSEPVAKRSEFAFIVSVLSGFPSGAELGTKVFRGLCPLREGKSELASSCCVLLRPTLARDLGVAGLFLSLAKGPDMAGER